MGLSITIHISISTWKLLSDNKKYVEISDYR